jgi:TolB-like protein
MSLFNELKRRNVFRVLLAYSVVGWLVLQVADVLVDAMELPVVWSKAVIALVLIGFIPTVVFSWIYELTPEGLKKESEIAAEESITGHTAKKLNHAILLLLVVAIGLFIYDRFIADTAAPPVAPTSQEVVSAAPGEQNPSVAVLAFENMSADADNEYFADGISEEILNLLADVNGMDVASRTSAFAFKGKNLPIPEIAAALKVRYVLEGSVRKAGEQVRVTAQLIDAETDRHLWSQTFDRALRDVFTIQDEVAAAIGEALQVQLLGEGGEVVKSESIDPDVYNRFLEARFLLRKRDNENMDTGTRLLIDVLAAEPQFARAHLLLAEAYVINIALENLVGEEFLLQLSNMHASFAREINPNLSGIEMILGNIAQSKDPLKSLGHYQRAIEQEPMEPRPYHWRGLLYNALGYGDRCVPDLERAAELDPKNPNVYFALSSCLQSSSQWDRAVEVATQGAAQGNPSGYSLTISARYQQGDIEGALGHLDYLQEELGVEMESMAMVGEILSGRVKEDELTDEQLETLGLPGAVYLKSPERALLLIAEREAGAIGWGMMGALFGAGRQAIRNDPRFIDYLDRSAVLDVWRELGPPAGCRAVGETFTCTD